MTLFRAPLWWVWLPGEPAPTKGWRRMAVQRWGQEASMVMGMGRYAILTRCPKLKVSLWRDADTAMRVYQGFNDNTCGTGCQQQHQIVLLIAKKERTHA